MRPTSHNAFIASSRDLKSARKHFLMLMLGFVAALAALNALGQVLPSPAPAPTNHTPALAVSESSRPATNQPRSTRELERRSETIRTACIQGRRRLCGRVMEISTNGLVVDSGFTSLLRPELSRSWVAPAAVSAERPPNLVEDNVPGAVAVGLVLVTDVPRRPPVKLYDYVILQAYPAGEYLYAPVPNVKKVIRRFSGGLETAIRLNFRAQ
jgi:hypothetical protein